MKKQRMMTGVGWGILIFLLITSADGKVIYVDAGAGSGGDGQSWGTAFKYLQDAFIPAYPEPGDEIWVAEGVYKPDRSEKNPGLLGDRNARFELLSEVKLYGGFPAAGGTWEQRDPATHETILSGDLAGNDREVIDITDLLIDPCRAENSYNLVWYEYGLDKGNNVLEGVTITRGTDSGIYVESYSNTINNCLFKENSGDCGGGINSNSGNIYITNCTFKNNCAINAGGAIYKSEFDQIVFVGCEFIGNYSKSIGGALCIYGGYGYIESCLFVGNRSGKGGAIIKNSFYLHIYNCSVICNESGTLGGGIYSYDESILNGCIFWGNTAGGVFWIEEQQIDGINEVTYSCIQDNDPWDSYIPFGGEENHNIDIYPRFVLDPWDGGDGWGVGGNDDYGDLHLKGNSPCIDAGDPDILFNENWPDLFYDFEGQQRFMGAGIDMGADEFLISSATVTRPGEGAVWAAGSVHDICWESYAVEDVDILLSIDGGYNWGTIAVNETNDGSYSWQIPGVIDSEQCVVLVVSSEVLPSEEYYDSGLFKIQPVVPGATVESSWPTLGRDFTRRGMSETNGPEVGCVKWQFATGGEMYTGVTVGASGRVHAACEDGRLYTLDPCGAELWRFDACTPLLSVPTVGRDGTIFVGGADKRFYAIDSDGQVRWTCDTDDSVYGAAAVGQEGQVFAGGHDGKVYAWDEKGNELWRFEVPGSGQVGSGILAAPSIGLDGSVYVGGMYNSVLYALDPCTGGVRWRRDFEYYEYNPYAPPWEDPCTVTRGSIFTAPVVGEDGTIYICLLNDSNLYAVDPCDGEILWGRDMADPCSGWFEPGYNSEYKYAYCYSEPAIGPDGTIYISFDDPYLRAVDPCDGDIKWVRKLGAVGGYSLAVGNDGLIYAASEDGVLSVLDEEGNELGQFAGVHWLSYPAIGGGGRLYLADAAGIVWALGRDGCEGESIRLHRPGDVDNDGVADIFDLEFILSDWLEEMYLKCSGEDINYNYVVDMGDLLEVAGRWLQRDCGFCGGADLTGDGMINLNDLVRLSEHWQELSCSDLDGYDIDGDGELDFILDYLSDPYTRYRPGDINRDLQVNIEDVAALAENWLKE